MRAVFSMSPRHNANLALPRTSTSSSGKQIAASQTELPSAGTEKPKRIAKVPGQFTIGGCCKATKKIESIDRITFPSPVSFSKKRKESFMTRRTRSEEEGKERVRATAGDAIYTESDQKQ